MLLKKFFESFINRNRSQRRNAAQHAARAKLQFEPLESRELLSADGCLVAQDLACSAESSACVATLALDDNVVNFTCDGEEESLTSSNELFYEDMADDLFESLGDETSPESCSNSLNFDDSVDDGAIFPLSFGASEEASNSSDALDVGASSNSLTTISSSEDESSPASSSSGGSSSGGSSSGGSSSGGSSSGGSSSGGSSSGGSDEHLSCHFNPTIEYYSGVECIHDSGWDGSARMMLTSENNIHVTVAAIDNDIVNGLHEELTLHSNGFSWVNIESVRRSDGSYQFSAEIDVSHYGELCGYFYVEDLHGNKSANYYIDYQLIQIDGFEYQEKTCSENSFHALEDWHVLWQENENRLRLLTTPQVNYDDLAEMAKFNQCFSVDVLARRCRLINNIYYDPLLESQWNSINYDDVGAYDLKIQIAQAGLYSYSIELPYVERYCLNRVEEIKWIDDLYDEDNEYVSVSQDGTGNKVFPEQNVSATQGLSNVVKNKVTASITLSVPIPQGWTATVVVDWFDPDNALHVLSNQHGSAHGIRDNNGAFAVAGTNNGQTPAVIVFGGNEDRITQWIDYEISGVYAGDNYVLAVHPNVNVLDGACFN